MIRILVPIKQVPETNAVKMDPVTGTMIREGVEAIVNPLDLYAIEAALRLREAEGGEIVVLSMGPPKAAAALREAVAMGCDRGILISGPKFAGADTWATSHVLAAAVRKVGAFDLILCGERATDGDTGQVGPALASFLELPVVTYVASISGTVGRGYVPGETSRTRRPQRAGLQGVCDAPSCGNSDCGAETASPQPGSPLKRSFFGGPRSVVAASSVHASDATERVPPLVQRAARADSAPSTISGQAGSRTTSATPHTTPQPGAVAPHTSIEVRRLVEDGYERLRVRMPAVLTVVKEIAAPRLPTFAGKRRARAMEIPVWGPDDLHLDPQDLGLQGSPTRVVKVFHPKVSRQCEKVRATDDASIQSACDTLVEFLQKKDLI